MNFHKIRVIQGVTFWVVAFSYTQHIFLFWFSHHQPSMSVAGAFWTSYPFQQWPSNKNMQLCSSCIFHGHDIQWRVYFWNLANMSQEIGNPDLLLLHQHQYAENKTLDSIVVNYNLFTIRKLYPDQRYSQFSGQSGTLIVCECKAIDFVGVSQTAHFEIYFSMSGPLIGVIIMGIGSVVLNQ